MREYKLHRKGKDLCPICKHRLRKKDGKWQCTECYALFILKDDNSDQTQEEAVHEFHSKMDEPEEIKKREAIRRKFEEGKKKRVRNVQNNEKVK